MCFQYGPGANPDKHDDDDDDVFITIGGKTLEIDDCLFSSRQNARGDLDKSFLTTPEHKEIYEPYGDKLFYSDFFEAEYEHNKLILEFKERDESGREIKKKIEIASGVPITIPLKRYTSVIDTKLIISDIGKDETGTFNLTREEFEDTFDSLDKWKVRVTLNNAPITFTYANMYHYPSGNHVVALSQNDLSLTAGLTHDDSKHCEGIGVDDQSTPHVFPMRNNKSEICYTFYYSGHKTIPVKSGFITLHKKILPSTTIRIPLNHKHPDMNKIMANTKYILTHQIDKEDFKKGITGIYGSRANTTNDPVYGYSVNLPYKETLKIEKGLQHK